MAQTKAPQSGNEEATTVAAPTDTGTLGGQIWHDKNANQFIEAGEQGIAGASVELVRDTNRDGRISADEVLGTAKTDAQGNYVFAGLAAGDDYQVRFATPEGYEEASVNSLSESVSVQAGEVNSALNAGFFNSVSLGDRVWNDTNANGVQDSGETGRAGITVELHAYFTEAAPPGANDDAPLEPVRTLELVDSQVTDEQGNYSFSGLPPGEYVARFVAPDGTVLSTANVGVDDAADSDADASTGGFTGTYVLASGDNNTGADAGIVQAGVATLGGQVWHDRNADQSIQGGEEGIAGASVELVRDANGDGRIGADEVLATAVTDAQGKYTFGGLAAGDNYQVRFATPEGYEAASGSTVSEAISLQAGEVNNQLDAGFFNLVQLGDRVWDDKNANGLQDTGETGRAGVTVELYAYFTEAPPPSASFDQDASAHTRQAPPVEPVRTLELVDSQTTDERGNYGFNGLPPGEYVLRFVAPDGTVLSTANVGTNDEIDSDADGTTGFTGTYVLASGDHNTSADAGLAPADVETVGVADKAEVCEDRSVNFNVLANDQGEGLVLVGVAHESAALDKTFKANGGAISFTADGEVSYKSMTNYYGKDKLVYTFKDAEGKTFTQTVDVDVAAVSDAPKPAAGAAYHPGGWESSFRTGNVQHYVHGYKLTDFGKFNDDADKLQQFGTYNNGAANDIDSAAFVRVYGLTTNATHATILFDGKPLDFSNGQFYDISIADINAGKLDLDFTKAWVAYDLKFAWVDSGTVDNDACYEGSIVSTTGNVRIATPVALDLSGDGQIGVTGATSSSQKDSGAELGRTVQFDIDADGQLDTIEWFDGSGDGILVDNRDGAAASQMNGARLFGNDGGAFSDGYDKLATLDANGDGQVSGDELAGLMLWVDNGDAQVQAGELRTLGEMGIAALSTQVDVTVDDEGRGHLQSTATRTDGSQIMSEDVYFAHGNEVPALGDVLGQDEGALDKMLPADIATSKPQFAAAMADGVEVGDVSQAVELLRRLADAVPAEALAA